MGMMEALTATTPTENIKDKKPLTTAAGKTSACPGTLKPAMCTPKVEMKKRKADAFLVGAEEHQQNLGPVNSSVQSP